MKYQSISSGEQPKWLNPNNTRCYYNYLCERACLMGRQHEQLLVLY